MKSRSIYEKKITCYLPIYYVASQFQPQDDGTIEYLISNGAYVDANGICDDKLFYHVYQNYFDFPHVWKAFISAGANVSEVHSFGQPANTRSALCYALQRNAPIEHFEALLEAGANINELLHPIVRAYYTKPKPRPKTPLDMARNAEREDLVTLFLKYGALTYDQIEQPAP